MKTSLVVLIGLCLLVGCGSDENSGGTPPVISDLSYFPTTAPVDQGGGSLPVNGSMNFVDPDGDVSTIRACSPVCDTGREICVDSYIFGAQGRVVGTVNFEYVVGTNCPAGTYTTSLYILDDWGLPSNTLTADFILTTP